MLNKEAVTLRGVPIVGDFESQMAVPLFLDLTGVFIDKGEINLLGSGEIPAAHVVGTLVLAA